MKIVIVKKQELFDIMQHVNLVKMKFSQDETWEVAPVLYTTEECIDIVLDSHGRRYTINIGDRAIFKFQRFGYEYLVSGEVNDISISSYTTLTIKFSMVQKYYNLRKHMRFDTNLKINIKANGQPTVESLMKNISKGGAMIVADADMELNSLIDIMVTFSSGNAFTAVAKILRKSMHIDNSFSYGVEFVEVSEDSNRIINKVISKYEKEYLKSLNILREYSQKRDSYFSTKISIFSYDVDESYEIREVLVKLGAENFDVFQKFKYYVQFFEEEKPRIVIIDAGNLSKEIVEMVQNISSGFAEIQIMMLLPISYSEKNDELENIAKSVNILFKPLIYNEFEEEIIKYL